MLPTSRIFRSRWSALIWAGGVIWIAIDVANSAGPAPPANSAAAASSDQAPDQADVAAIANILHN